MLEDTTFEYMNEDREFIKYQILYDFSKNNKNYIIFKNVNDENNEELFSALYEKTETNLKIIPIEDNQDYDVVDNFLESL